MRTKANIKINVYNVLREAVEQGVSYGWNRAHKYVEDPDDESAIEQITCGVMNELSEVVNFEGDE